jgi:protein-S-isoprenylcysteine O-methyltransferase Ste14
VTLHTVLRLAFVVFPISEIALAIVKRPSSDVHVDDRGSLRLLWLVITPSVFVAFLVSGYRATALPLSAIVEHVIAAVLLLAGLALRWTAILTLGRFFTANVAIHEHQAVITRGPYRYVRHPSYTGLLMVFVGLGVFLDNWLSLAVLVLPITLAVMHRIRLEESVLVNALGPAYSDYCARTRRLIPGVF